jgi:ATP/maltotriose-dependent transcriptional regulator MalT/DNA-binding SARP family transcriptional activator
MTNQASSPASRASPVRLAKLTPPLTDGLVPRDRLFERLDAHRAVPMVWVSAPPGAGKTSLVASYLDARGLPTLWMQLDAGDTDPATFFHYLSLAARAPAADASRLPVFTPDDVERPASFARRLFRELFARLPVPTVVVFDNAQEAAARSTLATLLAVMLEEQPAGFQVICVSRADPPAELARARAARQIAFIEWQDLQFRDAEARALAATTGPQPPGVIDRVLEQTQGWAAGIVLLLDRGAAAERLADAAMVGGREAVFDYLAEQAFYATSLAAREGLLLLSYLPRMSLDMAKAITGEASIGELLDDLARRHLFTERRFEPAPTYQFHALFRDFLEVQAARAFGASGHRARSLAAARLLHAGDHAADAYPLYARAGAWDEATRLVLDSAPRLVEAGRHQTLAEWIDGMPRPARDASPWLTYWLGVAKTGLDRSASRVALERALARFALAADRKGEVHALAALLGAWWSEPSSVVWMEPYTRRLAALLDEDGALDVQTLALGLASLASARLLIRPTDRSLHQHVRRLAELPLDTLPPTLALAAGTCLLQFYWGLGDADACEGVVRRTHAVAERSDLPAAERTWFWFWLMTHRVYQANADGARAAMAQARRIRDQSRRAPPFIDFVRWDVTVEMQRGRIREARRLLDTELEPHRQDASLFTQACIGLEQVRCAVEEHRFELAIEQGRQALAVCRDAGHDWLRVVIGLSVCCAQALSGRVEDGFRMLEDLRRLTTQALPIQAASVAAYEALLHLCSGDREKARAALDLAVERRGSSAYVWGPGWNRPAIARLAAFALEEGRHVATMRRFIEALQLQPPTADIEHWPWPVRIRVLDGFALQLADAGADTRRRKAPHRLLQLLKVLAAHGGRAVAAERLCDAVWPDADGDAARRLLDTSLSRLRRLLRHEDAVQVQAGMVSLDPHRVQVDLQVFADRLERLEREPVGTPAWAACAERSLEPYRRALLADDGDEGWLAPQREQWRRRWLRVVRQLAQHRLDSGESARAWALIDSALAIDGRADSSMRRELLALLARCEAAGVNRDPGKSSTGAAMGPC